MKTKSGIEISTPVDITEYARWTIGSSGRAPRVATSVRQAFLGAK